MPDIRPRFGFTLALIVFTLALPRIALGQSNDPDRMYQLAGEAAQLFQSGEFENAAQRFSDAFDAYPNYDLKKNEMVAWFKANNCTRAISAGEQYIREAENVTSQDRSDVRTVKVRCEIRTAKNRLAVGELDEAEQALKQALAAGPTEEEKIEIEHLQEQIDERRTELTRDRREPDPGDEPAPAESSSRPLGAAGVAGYGLTAAGIGGLGVVIGLNVWNRNNSNEWFGDIGDKYGCDYDTETRQYVEDSNADTTCRRDALRNDQGYQQLVEDVESTERKLRLGAVASSVAIVAGGGLLLYHYVFSDDETPPQAMIGPWFGAGEGGISVHIAF